MPDNFKHWINENRERLERGKSLPLFVGENKNFTDEKIGKRYKEFQKLQADKNYTDVSFNRKNGGLKATHRLHNFDPQRGHYEKEVREILFENGDKIVLESEFGFGKKIEGYYNDLPAEIKTLEKNNPRTIRKRIAQSVEKGAEVSILYFPNGFELDLSEILKGYFGELPKIVLIDKNNLLRNDVK